MLEPTEDEEPARGLSAWQAAGLLGGTLAAATALTVLVFGGMAGVAFLADNSWIVWTALAIGLTLVAFNLRERHRRAMAEDSDTLQ